MPDRIRRRQGNPRTAKGKRIPFQLPNPYPWMSRPEALVHLELERRGVPFSWRWFDAVSPGLSAVMPDYQPEFTLREYRVVIIVQGNFFGYLAGVIDRIALAAVLLEAEGWKVVILTEGEILSNLQGALDREAPALLHPTILGAERPNPFGHPDATHGRRALLATLALANLKPFKKEKNRGSSTDRRRRIRRAASRGGA